MNLSKSNRLCPCLLSVFLFAVPGGLADTASAQDQFTIISFHAISQGAGSANGGVNPGSIKIDLSTIGLMPPGVNVVESPAGFSQNSQGSNVAYVFGLARHEVEVFPNRFRLVASESFDGHTGLPGGPSSGSVQANGTVSWTFVVTLPSPKRVTGMLRLSTQDSPGGAAAPGSGGGSITCDVLIPSGQSVLGSSLAVLPSGGVLQAAQDVDMVLPSGVPFSIVVTGSLNLSMGAPRQQGEGGSGRQVAIVTVLDLMFQDAPLSGCPEFQFQPQDQAVTAGDDVQLTGFAWGGDPINYQWYKDNLQLSDDGHFSGTQTGALQIDSVVVRDAGLYHLRAAAGPCFEDTDPIYLAVLPACTGDANHSGIVNIDDLVMVITSWGQTGSIPADLNHDNAINIDDLVLVITHWGACP